MKLINYNRGYSNFFDCSIHGRIIVTEKEWEEIKKYLRNPSVKYDHKFLLEDDIKRELRYGNNRSVNLRVSATDRVVNRFSISNYKRGNYIFSIV